MRRLLFFVGALAFAAAALGAPAFAQSVTTNQTLDDCKLIPDDAARLACFDRVTKAGRGDVPGTGANVSPVPIPQPSAAGAGAGAAARSAISPGAPVATGANLSPPMTAEERREAQKKAFGLPAYTQPDVKQTKKQRLKKLATQVASVGVTGVNRLRVTTTDGQVWDQTEGTAPPANVGDTFVIKAGVMGSKLCKVGSAETYRCVRADRVADEEDATAPAPVTNAETTAGGASPGSGGASLAPATVSEASPPPRPPAPLPVQQTAGAGGPGSGGAGAGGPGTLGGRGNANVSPPPMTAEQRREAATKSFGLPEAEQPGAQVKKQDEVSKLTTRVASVGITGPNRLRITTTDGQVWDQTEGSPPVANIGDTFKIKAGFLGSKICQVGSARSYRCVRSDRPQQS